MEREGGGEGGGGGTTLVFFFFPCAHAQRSPPLPVTLFIAVHPPGVDGGGGFRGGSPTGRART